MTEPVNVLLLDEPTNDLALSRCNVLDDAFGRARHRADHQSRSAPVAQHMHQGGQGAGLSGRAPHHWGRPPRDRLGGPGCAETERQRGRFGASTTGQGSTSADGSGRTPGSAGRAQPDVQDKRLSERAQMAEREPGVSRLNRRSSRATWRIAQVWVVVADRKAWITVGCVGLGRHGRWAGRRWCA